MAGVCLFGGEAFATAQETPETLYQKAIPSVVYIMNDRMDGGSAIGSGFLIRSDGVIATNYHVFQGAQKVSVRFSDGIEYPVTGVLAYSLEKDFCLLKIDADNLPVLPMGDSHQINIGAGVYAIGNPLGFEYSFSQGTLSGKRMEQTMEWLQFTAPVSPGNSGGPLLNARGEAVGIVTFIMTEGQNINFALGINEIKEPLETSVPMTFEAFIANVSQVDLFYYEGVNAYAYAEYDKAREMFEKVLAVRPEDKDALYQLGLVFYDQKDFQQAKICFEKVLGLMPDNPGVYDAMGVVYRELGDIEKAKEFFQKSIEIDPQYFRPHVDLGYLSMAEEDLEEAKLQYAKAMELAPDDWNAYHYLGVLYMEYVHDPDTAKRYLDAALELNPKSTMTYYAIGLLYLDAGDSDTARKYFEAVLNLDPYYYEAYYSLGFVYYYAGQAENALWYANKVMELGPDRAESNALMGSVFLNLNEAPLKAKPYFEKAIKIDPNYFLGIQLLGQTYVELGDYEQAKPLFERCIQLDPSKPEAYVDLGVALSHLGHLKEAREYYQKALEISPDLAAAYQNLAGIYVIQKDYVSAKTCLNKVIELQPKSAVAFYLMGEVYDRQGNKQKGDDLKRRAESLCLDLGHTLQRCEEAQQQWEEDFQLKQGSKGGLLGIKSEYAIWAVIGFAFILGVVAVLIVTHSRGQA